MGIAHYAGIGRSSCKVFFYKIVYHKIAKLFSYIQYKMRKPVLHSGKAGIVKTINIAATGFFFGCSYAAAGIIPGFHGNAHYFIPFVMQH